MRRRLSMDILWFRKWLNKTMSTKVKAAIVGLGRLESVDDLSNNQKHSGKSAGRDNGN